MHIIVQFWDLGPIEFLVLGKLIFHFPVKSSIKTLFVVLEIIENFVQMFEIILLFDIKYKILNKSDFEWEYYSDDSDKSCDLVMLLFLIYVHPLYICRV